MKRAILLVLICACKTTSESESRLTASAAETLDTQEHTETHVEEAPSKTTTTVEEFAPPQEEVVPTEPADKLRSRSLPDGLSATQGVVTEPEHGPLVKRTVTVEERGPVSTSTVTDAKSQEREDTILSSETKTTKTTDFLHSPFALLGGLVALAGVAFAAFKILKPRLL